MFVCENSEEGRECARKKAAVVVAVAAEKRIVSAREKVQVSTIGWKRQHGDG